MRSASTVRRRVIRAELIWGFGRPSPAKKPVHGALIRPPAMLSTGVNPTDGLRFDGDADSFAEDDVHP
jgi:hypothetical protein